jgi:hypothetical protein
MRDVFGAMRLTGLAGLLLGAVCAIPGAANAAPQALGLVASSGVPTPLTCAEGVCSAVFTTFCLQEARPGPSYGDRYTVAPGGSVDLVLTMADGRQARVPAADRVSFTSLVGFTSLKISLPQESLDGLGALAAAVEIGPGVSLIPVAQAGDPNPQTAEELALATGPMRAAGAQRFEGAAAQAGAARLTTVLINALPAREAYGERVGEALWRGTMTPQIVASATPEALAAARQVYDTCRIALDSRSALSMRSCLELEHAELMARENHAFWESMAGY